LVGTVELRSGVTVFGEPAGLTVTYLSEEEIAPKAAVRLEAQVRFQSIDTNGDGTLDAFELCCALCESGLTDNEIEALFFKLDSNNDNQVSEAEFIDGYSTLISQHLVN
jgi:Ca2+-binding EF-hand superfamily protein